MKKIPVWKMVRGVLAIHEKHCKYDKGCDGSNGHCDCIGMQRGAAKNEGVDDIQGMNGTNYALRHTYLNVQKIKNKNQLREGDAVLKFRDKDDSNMRLPDQYRKGGSDYSAKWGEMNCTHTGTVTSTDPLIITHMTSPTSKQDKDLGNWTYFGQFPFVDYADDQKPAEDDNTMEPTHTAYVYASSGKTVKMRAKPSTLSRLYWEVPINSEVVVMSQDGNWSEIIWAGRTGYMQTKFLMTGNNYRRYTVTVKGMDEAQKDALIKLYPQAIVEEEKG